MIGRRLMAGVLMDQTRPLKLPEHLSARAHSMMEGWRHDPKAPRWMNALERHLAPGATRTPARQ